MRLEGIPTGSRIKMRWRPIEIVCARFRSPIQFETDVKCVRKEEDRFIIDTHQGEYHAKALIIATGRSGASNSDVCDRFRGHSPAHSSDYRRPSQLQEGGVLVVGGGNSGAQIAVELSRSGNVFGPRTAPRYLPMTIGERACSGGWTNSAFYQPAVPPAS